MMGIRRILWAAVIVSMLPMGRVGRAADTVEVSALGEAREVYSQIEKKAKQTLILALEGAIATAAGNGEHAIIRQFRDQQDAFRKTGRLPQSPDMAFAVARYRTTMSVAERFLDGYFLNAMTALKKAGATDEEARVSAEWRVWKSTTLTGQNPVVPPPMAARSAVAKPMPNVPGVHPLAGANASGEQSVLRVVEAKWGFDPRFAPDRKTTVVATQVVQKRLDQRYLLVTSKTLGLTGETGPKCLTMVLAVGDHRLNLALHESSEISWTELTSEGVAAKAIPIRGTPFELMSAGWGLQGATRREDVTAAYAEQFSKSATAEASTKQLGELEFGTPKTLNTAWRIGQTFLLITQAENSQLTIPSDGVNPSARTEVPPPAVVAPPASGAIPVPQAQP